MQITVLTPERTLFKGTIVSVKVPGTAGQFQVLKNHAPLVSSLANGTVEIVTSSGQYSFFDEETGSLLTEAQAGKKVNYKVSGGFIEVLNNEISLLVSGVKKV